jgi:transposase-like protein
VVSAFVATAFAQDDADSAKQQWRRVADQLRPKVPKLAALMDEAEPDVLAYMTFPQQHRAKLHSTNPLERLNGEISAAPRSSESFPTRPPSPAWSGRSCSSRTMNGPSSAPAT